MADRFPDIQRLDMVQNVFNRPTSALYDDNDGQHNQQQHNQQQWQQQQSQSQNQQTNPFAPSPAPSGSSQQSNPFAPQAGAGTYTPNRTYGSTLAPSQATGWNQQTQNQPMSTGWNSNQNQNQNQNQGSGWQGANQPMTTGWQGSQQNQNQNQLGTGFQQQQQQPMYTGWNQPHPTGTQPLVPQETYSSNFGGQQGMGQQGNFGQQGGNFGQQGGSFGQQGNYGQNQWSSSQQGVGNFGSGMGYNPTGTGFNAPSQAHAQTAAMTQSGYSAFDPFSPTGGSMQSQQQQQSSQYSNPNPTPSYSTPSYTASRQDTSVGNTGGRPLFMGGEGAEWVQNCLASRRSDLGPPIRNPRTFAESYRIIMDQAYENVLNAIARNNKADISVSLEVSTAAQSVREMLFREQGEFGLRQRENEPTTRAANRRLAEDVRLALYMRRAGPWANDSVFNDVVEDSISGLKDVFPF